ncbi:MAG: response regulator transcription factor [Bacteroidota bacterium]
MKKIKVLLVEDQPVYIDGLKAILMTDDHIEVIGTALNGEDAIQFLKKARADVVLLDINMPVMDGLATIPHIRNLDAETDIIMLTIYDEPRLILKFLEQDIAGFLLKESTGQEILEAIRSVAAGGTYYGTEVMKSVTHHLRKKREAGDSSVQLTKREAEIVQLIIQEFTAPEIADRLCPSITTASKPWEVK